LDVFREMDTLGGVLPRRAALQRSKIQEAAHNYGNNYAGQRSDHRPQQIHQRRADAERPLGARHRPATPAGCTAPVPSKQKTAKKAPAALQKLENVARSGGNVFAELVHTVEVWARWVRITRA